MSDAISIVGSSMRDDVAKMGTVSMNISNLQTPGYKRSVSRASSDFSATVNQSSATQAATTKTSIDTSSGTAMATHGTFDISLTGTGFLEVSNGQGLAYTRQGGLHVDAKGQLTTANGDIVQGTSGPITISSQKVNIAPDGTISDNGRPVGQLKIVSVPVDALIPAGAATFHLTPGAQVSEDRLTRVSQGYLENSNVDSTNEVVLMMETMRHFEGLQKVALGYDEMMETAIGKLGGQ